MNLTFDVRRPLVQSLTVVPRAMSDRPPRHVGVCPEVELLLLCARGGNDPDTSQYIGRLIEQGIDWGFFLGAALSHQMSCLVYWNLNRACPELVPESLRQRLRTAYNLNATRNLFMTAEVYRILGIFKEYGIPAVSIKGPLQAAEIYGNLALREISDLDFLVHKQDVLPAKEALVAHGFRPYKIFTPEQEQAHINGHAYYDYPFISTDGKYLIELHWLLLPLQSAFGLTEQFTWEEVREVAKGGRTMMTFPVEEQFLLQCEHNEQHNWRGLKFICDVARMLEKYPEMNWGMVMERATRIGRERTLLLTLHMAKELLAAPLPPELKERIEAGPSVKYTSGLLRAEMFRDGFRLPGFTEWLECSRRMGAGLDCRGLGIPGCFLRYLKVILTPERIDRVLFPVMPAWLSFLYCLARIFRFCSFHTGIHLPKKKIKVASDG